ncbi:MAG: hypothetical protein K0B01_08705 [Syntrophobacterales bacterium]|nr:hypothetical protein [Syntrophobacterales bacterium]
MRRQRIYRILTGGFLVVAAIAALFFADIVEYFSRDQTKQAAVQAEKTVVFNDAQRQAFLEPVKRTIEQGNLSEALSLLLKRELCITPISSWPIYRQPPSPSGCFRR